MGRPSAAARRPAPAAARPRRSGGPSRLWAGLAAAVLLWEAAGAQEEEEEEDYILPVDPTFRPLHRMVVRPDGSPCRLVLVNHGSAVRAFELDPQTGEVLSEMDVSDPVLQADMVLGEREVHGVSEWPTAGFEAAEARHKLWRSGSTLAPACPVPDDTHLERSVPGLYEAAFLSQEAEGQAPAAPPRTDRLLQLGGLYDSVEGDPARTLVSRFKLRGLVVAGAAPEGGPDNGWQQGLMHGELEATLEGGAGLLRHLQRSGWSEVDVVRLEDLPGGCLLLRGLLAAGLRAGMVVTIVNGQFPPPLRFASLAGAPGAEFPAALYGCSLSYMMDLLQPHGFRLVRYSGPYAAFLHESRLSEDVGPSDPDEFACYRGARIWGFKKAMPMEAVRDWFFSEQPSDEIWRRCWGNVSEALASSGAAAARAAPGFLLHL